MRMNLPVTATEHVMGDGQLIVSRTDLKGRISHVNRDFMDISGFTEQELLGAPHNLIRHPDMPSAVFKDMWDRIQSGRPWTGIVKNRCKNGDFYWVEANVSSLREQGTVTGYISVRRKPTPEQIAEAEALYARLRAGKPARPFLHRILSRLGGIRVTRALPLGLTAIVLFAGFALALSLMSLRTAINQVERISNTTQALEQAYSDMYGHGLQIVGAMRFLLTEPTDKQARDNVERSGEIFASALEQARRISVGDAGALSRLGIIMDNRKQQIEVQRRIIERLDAGDIAGAKDLYVKKDNVIWRAYRVLIMDGLREIRESARQERSRFIDMAKKAEHQSLGVSLFVLLAAVLLGVWLTRRIAGPIRIMLDHLEAISNGDYSTRINVCQRDEFGEMMQAVKSVQSRLDFDIQDARQIASESLRIRRALDIVTLPVTVSDDRNRLVYMNVAAQSLWQSMASEIRCRHPDFDPAQLMGGSLASYFEDEAARSAYRGELTAPLTIDTCLAKRQLRVTPCPIWNAAGAYQGRVTLWFDRTAETAAEQEIAGILQAAGNGDFSQRILIEDQDGFFRELAEGMNRLLEIMAVSLTDIGRVIGAIARGDLTQRIETDYQGTLEEVKTGVNTTVANLKDLVSRIREAVDTITTASKEIATGNQDLSQRTEEQASSLEETASSMEELTSTVKQNADNARQASQLAISASDVALKGGSVVSASVETMAAISESSKKIADIIGVIDGIAFQTNILALNAAVEAARAGEQGRGFAVVAAEVRNLAQRSANAAKEIKTLIGDSVAKVDAGTVQVNEAGQRMTEIVQSIKRVTDLVAEISAASNEQSSGIEQVNQAITQMDDVAQQNAALVEEAAAAAESLEEQAQKLASVVAVFRLDQDGTHAMAEMARARPSPSHRAPQAVKVRNKPAPNKSARAEDDWDEF